MNKYEIYPGTLYDYSAGVYCGVLITEKVMKKLVALQTKHAEDVKRILTDECERGNVFSSMWTLHYPEGVQTTVNFIDTSALVSDRIKLSVYGRPPVAVFPVFIAGSMDEAKGMADCRYGEMKGEADG